MANKEVIVKGLNISYRDIDKEKFISLTDSQLKFVYADEADLLNVALFGKTAGEWRKENPTLNGNFATLYFESKQFKVAQGRLKTDDE